MTRTNHKKREYNKEQNETVDKYFSSPRGAAHVTQSWRHVLIAFSIKKYLLNIKLSYNHLPT